MVNPERTRIVNDTQYQCEVLNKISEKPSPVDENATNFPSPRNSWRVASTNAPNIAPTPTAPINVP